MGEDLLALSAEYEAYVRSGRPAADFEASGPSVTVRDGLVLIEAASTSDGAALMSTRASG